MITSLIQFKKFNISGAGNQPNTPLRSVQVQLQTGIQQAVDSYHSIYKVLLACDLDGEWKTCFKKLNAADVCSSEENITLAP